MGPGWMRAAQQTLWPAVRAVVLGLAFAGLCLLVQASLH